ncbi:hypothetical protein QWI17_20820 [Gilvimarinus sp. SDUM040013]|uniref:Haemolysin-type calcium binding-related domain-containing protein n=1 Tax=Gilvimarinus gilvus TaxID=3058038 RepID=A0ABU4RSJ6_9GAMM|nr:hypothetical protein [Gilvimarinus sp. SDUM040013]MDO3388302.1 hypothetical protein [Gilvimarinus sp. SDUM040013]MDX6847852.1 hypothetical protein [Gilvimarinus sp. SDUM040013]
MYIHAASLHLEASYSARTSIETHERFDLRFSTPGAIPERRSLAPMPERQGRPDLSQAGSLLRLERQTVSFDAQPLSANDRLQISIIQELYRQITGRRMQIGAPRFTEPGVAFTLDIPIFGSSSTSAGDIASGVGMIYERTQIHRESARLQVRAAGQVTTGDGQVFDIRTALNMSRDFERRETLSVRIGDAALIDPLVINFDGFGARLSDREFEFDLDSDGTVDHLASLAAGSGYLALDRNGDGIVNNGRELFGPSTGRGFAELAEFDSDGNGFIDEADAVYDKLRIWRRFADGSQQLMALGEAGVGAIYLGHVTSPFSLKNADNETLGEIASTSIYLREDGTSGVVQQVNLAV